MCFIYKRRGRRGQMGLEIPQACSIASELYIHFYFLYPPPYDEALRIQRTEVHSVISVDHSY